MYTVVFRSQICVRINRFYKVGEQNALREDVQYMRVSLGFSYELTVVFA